jgi:hypothetical protein
MGTFKTFLESKKITASLVATTSARVEALDAAARTLLVKRTTKRRVAETKDKKYAELNLEKPKTSGRAISLKQVEAAISEKAITRKARGKILRAVNVILAKKSEPVADMKILFEGQKAQVGKKIEKEKKK